MVKKHFSPITGKMEVCRALKRDYCPYRFELHTESEKEAKEYMDNYLEQVNRLPRGQEDYFRKELQNPYERGMPQILSTRPDMASPAYRITEETLLFLRMGEDLKKTLLSKEAFFLVPEGDAYIQRFLQNPDGMNDCYRTLSLAYDKKRLGKPYGKPYEKWDAVPMLDAVKSTKHAIILDVPIHRKGPNGEESYTLREVFEEYKKIKEEQGLFREYPSRYKKTFYAIMIEGKDASHE